MRGEGDPFGPSNAARASANLADTSRGNIRESMPMGGLAQVRALEAERGARGRREAGRRGRLFPLSSLRTQGGGSGAATMSGEGEDAPHKEVPAEAVAVNADVPAEKPEAADAEIGGGDDAPKPKSKPRSNPLFEEEADEGSDDDDESGEGGPGGSDDDDDDDDEDGEGLDAFEKDDFLVDSDEEEDEAGARERRESRAAAGPSDQPDGAPDAGGEGAAGEDDSDEELELADEDLEIAGKARRRKRRLKKASGAAPGRAGAMEEAGVEGATAEELQRKLFGRTDLEDEDDGPAPAQDAERSDESDGFDSDSGDSFEDFIDDTDIHRKRVVTEGMDEVEAERAFQEEQARLKRSKKLKRRMQKQRARTLGIMDSSQLREAQELFGDVDGMLNAYYEKKADRTLEITKGGLVSEQPQAKLLRKVEPGVLDAQFVSTKDNDLRRRDVPERLQLTKGHGISLSEAHTHMQTQWIYANLLCQMEDTSGSRLCRRLLEEGVMEAMYVPRDMSDAASQMVKMGRLTITPKATGEYGGRIFSEEEEAKLKAAIKTVVTHIQEGSLEVPSIAMGRREDCGALLSLREEDAPMTTSKDEAFESYTKKGLFGFKDFTLQAHQRKIRRWDVLWTVQSLCFDWVNVFIRADKRLEAYRALKEVAESIADGEEEVGSLQACIDLLEKQPIAKNIDDADAKFKLIQSFVEHKSQGIAQGMRKRPGRSASKVVHWRRSVPPMLIRALCISPGQLASNLASGYRAHKPVDPEINPLDLAEREGRGDANRALESARHLAALQLSVEPGIRRQFRAVYLDQALVSTEPTKQKSEIRNPLHLYGPVSRLEDKPMKYFEEAQWLLIAGAERDGVLSVEFKMPPDALEDVERRFIDNFVSDLTAESSREWNLQRKTIIKECIYDKLLPMLEHEARNILTVKAKDWACQTIGDELWNLLSCTQWEAHGVDASSVDKDIMSCIWGEGEKLGGFPTTFVMLDRDGNLTDFLQCEGLSGTMNLNVNDIFRDSRYRKSAEDVKKFIVQHKPQAIALGCGSVQCMQLKRILEYIASDVVAIHTQEMADNIGAGEDIHVLYTTEAVASLWAVSDAGRAEIQHGTNIRQCVALARLYHDPLPVYASLFSSKREILGLNMHAVQRFLSADEQYQAFERCMITIVNQVGVDINDVVQHSWKSHTLPFVAGLGPRKASSLINYIKSSIGGAVQSRDQLREFLDQKVYENVAPVLRIEGSALSEDILEVFDGTRIHPEHYDLAHDMADEMLKGAGEIDRVDMDRVERDKEERGIIKVLQKYPDLVDRFGMKEYAEGKGKQSMLLTLANMSFEFKSPFGELRSPWSLPKEREEFEMITSEIKDLIRPGRTCNCRRMNVGTITETSDGAGDGMGMGSGYFMRKDVVLLDSGLVTLIDKDQVPRGASSFEVRIQSVKPTKRIVMCQRANGEMEELEYYDIQLSTHLEEDASKWENTYCKDPYYKPINTDKIVVEKQKKRQIEKRIIVHDFFKNAEYKEVEELLERKESGCFLFRPCSGGFSMLSLTIKLSSDPPLFLNEKIEELDDEGNKDYTPKLGKQLRVMKAKYSHESCEEIDEVISTFVIPLIRQFDSVKRHRKFIKAFTRDELHKEMKKAWDTQLIPRKGKMVRQTQIAVSFDYDKKNVKQSNGYVRLSYIFDRSISGSLRSEKIYVLPETFIFRHIRFSSIEEIYAYFKKNPIAKPEKPDVAQGYEQAYERRRSPPKHTQTMDYGQPPRDAYANPPPPLPPPRDPYAGSGQYGQEAYGQEAYGQAAYGQGAYDQGNPPYGEYNNGGYGERRGYDQGYDQGYDTHRGNPQGYDQDYGRDDRGGDPYTGQDYGYDTRHPSRPAMPQQGGSYRY